MSGFPASEDKNTDGVTGLISIDSAVEGMKESIPSYRSQHIEANERALRAGYDAVTPGLYPAWKEVAV